MANDDTIIAPPHIMEMTLAMTPQQLFEGADRMLTQAASVHECAEELHAQVRSLNHKADNLREKALDLQKQGVDSREEINIMFGRVLKQYKDILPQYTAQKPLKLEKISLAVEEGRALKEQIETFANTLRIFSEAVRDKSSSAESSGEDQDEQNLDETLLKQLQSTHSAISVGPSVMTSEAKNSSGGDVNQENNIGTRSGLEDTARKRKLEQVSNNSKEAVPERKKKKRRSNLKPHSLGLASGVLPRVGLLKISPEKKNISRAPRKDKCVPHIQKYGADLSEDSVA